jgi:cytochrome c oxidase cbb3-type subunit 3
MNDERRDKVRDHEFDGIQEFDNRLPRWWVGTFILTVLAALFLWTTRHTFGTAPTVQDNYAKDLAELKALQEAKASQGPTDAEVLAWVADKHELAEGQRIFGTNCIACHGAHGQGGIGPNLTDGYWLHGGKPGQVAATIGSGVPEKGMPTWRGVLASADIRHAAAYVVSLRGSHPAEAKAPQGVKEE